MPTNEWLTEDEGPSRREEIAGVVRRAAGATPQVPLRVLTLFTTIAVCMAMAPLPINLVGVGAVALLALDTAIHRR